MGYGGYDRSYPVAQIMTSTGVVEVEVRMESEMMEVIGVVWRDTDGEDMTL